MPVPCARCLMPLQTRLLAINGAADCTLCGASNQAWLFPAAITTAPLVHPETAQEGEATCYEHADKRATAACQQCGRFLCQFCAVESGNTILCPSCVMSGRVGAAKLNPTLPMFDSIALILPLVTLIMYPFTIAAAPASVVLTLMKWRRPISPVRRSRWRFILALIISLTEIGLWTWLVVYVIAQVSARAGNQQ